MNDLESSRRFKIIQDSNEKVKGVRDRLKAALSSQKSFKDVRGKDHEFQVSVWVFSKLSPWKGVVRFGNVKSLVRDLLVLMGFKIKLALLRIEQPISLKKDLTYDVEPVQVLDRKEQMFRNKSIPFVRVLWRSHQVEEATWELEQQMRQQYFYLFDC
ncbi:PREDICTED: uncharacterized protein LOC101310437 [Fragaria vesca subsp. vesca]